MNNVQAVVTVNPVNGDFDHQRHQLASIHCLKRHL